MSPLEPGSTPARPASTFRDFPPRGGEAQTSLRDVLMILRRNAWLILLATGLGAGGALLATSQQDKVYRTSAQLIVAVGGTDSEGQPISRRPVAVQAATVLGELASTPPAVTAARRAARLPPGDDAVVAAQSDDTSPFLRIIVTGQDPAAIAKLANAFASTLPSVATRLDQVNDGDSVQLQTLAPATVNTVPVSPRPRRNLAVGLALGLVVGLAGAYGRSSLDRQMRDSADIEDLTGLPVLGAIPDELGDERLPAVSHPGSLRSEAYRFVRTNVQFADLPDQPRTILITSASAGEGKTSLAANLAASCAQAGERVVVVDADLRRPRVAHQFRMNGGLGLTDVLCSEYGDVGTYTKPAADGLLSVLPSGQTPVNPSEILGSEAMVRTLARLADRFDRVIIDAPPVLPVVDAVKLASMVSGVVLVARMGSTTRDELTAALKRLEKASANVLGVVANRAVPTRDRAYGYGTQSAYVYATSPTRAARRRRRQVE